METAEIERERVRQARERYYAAHGIYLPELSLNYTHSYRNIGGNSYWYSPWISAKVKQNILNGLDQFTAPREASHLKKQAEHIQDSEHLTRFEDVSRAYYQLLEKEKILENNSTALILSRRYLGILQERRRLGRNRVSEVLQEQAVLARLEAEQQSHLHQRDVLREELAFLTGLSPDKIALTPLDSADETPAGLPSLDAALTKVRSRPDILAAKEYRAAVEQSATSATGRFLPDIYVQGEYYLQREPYTDSVSSVRTGDWYVELGAEFPLFQGGTRYFERNEALSQKREAELLYQYEIRRAETDVRSAWREVEGYRNEEEKYRVARDWAEKYQNAAIREYTRGIIDGLDLVRARQDLLDISDLYETARHQRALAETRLLVVSGIFPGAAIKESP